MTPGRDRLLLRFSSTSGATEYLWAEYEILSAEVDRCSLTLRALYFAKEGHELETPEGLEDEPFFPVDEKPQRASQAVDRKAA